MKSAIKQFFIVFVFVTTNYISYAQTPYDDFAPGNKKKEILKLPEATFKAYNTDTTSKIKYLELDKETLALSYYGASDSLLKQVFLQISDFKWISVDPMSNGRPGLTPYNYCQNSPIVRIDPNGMWDDNFIIDNDGNITLVEKTNDNFDMLYTKDSWDNGKKDNSILVDKGILNNKYSQSVKDPGDNKWYRYDIFKVKGDDKAKSLFEFVTKNTNVEWSRSMVGVDGAKGMNYITTSQLGEDQGGREYGGGDLYRTQLISYTYRGNDHSHDNNSSTISYGDVALATQIQLLHPDAKFNIYLPQDGRYIPFNANSIPALLSPAIIFGTNP